MTESEAEELESSEEIQSKLVNPSLQLMKITRESNLDPDLANEFRINFEEHFKMANEWSKKAKNIIVTNENQTVLMEQARVARLFIRSKRLEIENFRKSKKEYYLRGGQAVDKVCTFLKNMIEPIENHLDLQEHYIEYKKKAETERIRLEVEAKMEAERIAKEKADAEALVKAQAENARLRKEAEAKERALEEERRRVVYEQEKLKKENEAKIAKERAEQQAKLDLVRKEQEAKLAKERAEADRQAAIIKAENDKKLAAERADREKVEAELRAKKQAEQKAEADKIREAERMLSAGDEEKIMVYRNDIGILLSKAPTVKGQKNIRIIEDIKSHLHLAFMMIKITVNEEEE